ncbi:hypothetical protein D3C72_1700170 [compost metagenome]
MPKRTRNDDPRSEGFPEKPPYNRRQKQKAENVGNEAGNDKQDPGNDAHGAIHQFIRRLRAGAARILKVSHHADAAET